MAQLYFDNVHIAALACAVPEHIQKVDLNPENPRARYIKQFVKQIGVQQRHISNCEQTCTDTAFAATKRTLEKTGLKAEDFDGIIFVTQKPDYNSATSNAHIMHHRLGMKKNSFAFDIHLGCSGFVFGLSTAATYLQQKHINRVLFITGTVFWDAYSSLDQMLAAESFLEGEGASALILEKKTSSPMTFSLHTDGSGYKYLYAPYGGVRNRWRVCSKYTLADGNIHEGFDRYMDGMEITNFTTNTVVNSIKDFLVQQNTSFDDYDALILHQPNLQIIKSMAKRLELSLDKVPVSVDLYANTDSVSIPLTICHALSKTDKERLSLLASGFGIGLSWGIVSFEIDSNAIEPIFTTSNDLFEEGFVKPA